MSLNALAVHRPSDRAYHERKSDPWLPRASAFRRATDVCASHPWTLGFRQFSFSHIAQALQSHRLHVLGSAPR